jgi:CheY-like chemotaxis protein
MIDDDRELCDLVSELLRGEGFEMEAHHSGAGAVDRAAAGGYDLVILDVMLPEQNGFEILRALRQRSAVPVILLTARGEDVDRIIGLEIGASGWRRNRAGTTPIHSASTKTREPQKNFFGRTLLIFWTPVKPVSQDRAEASYCFLYQMMTSPSSSLLEYRVFEYPIDRIRDEGISTRALFDSRSPPGRSMAATLAIASPCSSRS